MSKLTYISLFSSAGVGCYGFKQEGFDCIATCELIEQRLNVQKVNKKCKYESGYIAGDLTNGETKEQTLIRECKEELNISLKGSDNFMEFLHKIAKDKAASSNQ